MINAPSAHARQGEAPLMPAGAGLSATPVLNLTEPNIADLLAEDAAKAQAGVKTYRYAAAQAMTVTPDTHGSWITEADGTMVWRLNVVSEGATDLNMGFTRFVVPAGTKLYVISADYDYYEGPYTAADNEVHEQLWVPVVPGSRAIIEMQVAPGAGFKPQIELSQIGYGYTDLFRLDLTKQGSCNNDVVCPEGDPWRDQIAAVGAYSLGGSIICTGSMIMDVPGSFRNFFLTAFHCGVTAGNAASVTVYWNFESPNCGDLSGGSLADNQTGAVFRARREDVDVALIELDDDPDPAHNVYYAGWDRSGTAPGGSVGIHHPRGDEKAISFNDDTLTTQNNCIAAGTNTHWRVNDWEDGTTEPGSSGSALFDPTSQLVVGFLSGGAASCTNIDYDCYGKFSVAWDGSASDTRLRDWLDPDDAGPNTVAGSFPNQPPVCDANGPYTVECAGVTTPVLLDGTGSFDPDGDTLTYLWTSDCPEASFDNASSAMPTLSIDTSAGCELSCTVTLEVNDGEFSSSCDGSVSVLDTLDPVLTCPDDITVECTATGGTPKDDPLLADFFADLVVTDVCDPNPSASDNAPALFPHACPGPTTTPVTFTGTDKTGNSAQCTADVTVEDTSDPVFDTLEVSRDVLWPPNHKMVDVTVDIEVSDVCDANVVVTLDMIVSSEPDNGIGDGNTINDIQNAEFGTDDRSFSLRSERSGRNHDGRTYTITYSVTDCSGNATTADIFVRVPHNQSGNAMAMSGFSADGTSLDPVAKSVEIVIPSDPGDAQIADNPGERLSPMDFDARRVLADRILLGNTSATIEPEHVGLKDVDQDGHADLVLTFDSVDISEILLTSEEHGLVGVQFRTELLGGDRIVKDVFALGPPMAMPEAAPEGTVAIGFLSVAPNPFNPQTTFSFTLASAEVVQLSLYNLRGELVRTLVDEHLSAGAHDYTWNGRDRSGQSVSSGFYLARFQQGGEVVTEKVTLLK